MIELVRVGTKGLVTSSLALGCMGMSEFYVGGTPSDCEMTIRSAVEQGITMFDTADMYGPFANEQLVGRCLKGVRSRLVIATKFGYVRHSDGTRLGLNGRPEYVKSACDASLRRLNTEYIDLYYLHRVDRSVPIEDTVGAMAELVDAGKVRYLGLSEVTAGTTRRAHVVHPITAVQSEYSLASRDPEFELFDTLRELGVGFVAYAPLGRGLLTGRFREASDIPACDYRRMTPRFLPENLSLNVQFVDALARVASSIGATPAQLALAWVRRKIPTGVVLVGTTNRLRLIENVQSFGLIPDDALFASLEAAFPHNAVHGARYPDMSRVNG